MGNNDANQLAIESAAANSEIHNDINYLTEGYKNHGGENEELHFQAGQKQRISIARALVKDPQLLILDDCLSAVDAKTEHKILENFKKEFEQKTVIFITHRIFTLMDFDQILVLDDGGN